MPTITSVDNWIRENVLDNQAWNNNTEQIGVAFAQAVRNLTRWYPTVELTDELVSYQSIWELQALDPVLKYQKHGVRAISEGNDRIDYLTRDKVAPDVRDILGAPSYETAEETIILEGGMLL
jgi:hypothetical protein